MRLVEMKVNGKCVDIANSITVHNILCFRFYSEDQTPTTYYNSFNRTKKKFVHKKTMDTFSKS